jgi:hypothetical protein
VRVLTVLVRFGTTQYPHAEQEIAEIFRRQLPSVERRVVVVDNALPEDFREGAGARVVIGGDNRSREFSAFDRAIAFVGSDIWSFDLVHFATSAFNTLHVAYLPRIDTTLLSAVARRPVCTGHIDCYNDAVEIHGFRSQHWIRTCFFFMTPGDVKSLGSFVTIRDGERYFSGDPQSPFRSEAALSQPYRDYITRWLTGEDIGQGVTWHSSFALTHETLPSFEQKALTIMNEQLLSVRLRAMGCRLIDVTWAATMLRRRKPSIDWRASWRDQLAARDRDAVVVAAGVGSL